MRGFRDEDAATKSDLVDLAVQLHHETPKAWLVSDTGDKEDAKWIPKSQAELADGLLTLPEWLAKEKGLPLSKKGGPGRPIADGLRARSL